MAVNDLTGTTWTINASPSLPSSMTTYNITHEFTDVYNDEPYTWQGDVIQMASTKINSHKNSPPSNNMIYDGGVWKNEDVRTITFTGGEDATNPSLIAWLYSNATQAVTEYPITYDLTHVTATEPVPTAALVSGYTTITIAADTGYDLPSSVTVTGATLSSYVQQTGVILLANATGDVTVKATGTAHTWTVSKTLDGVSATVPTTIKTGQSKSFTVKANNGYILPEDISVENASYTYNKTTGAVTISAATGNVTIKIFGKVAVTIMANKGGYQIVNLKGVSLTAGTQATIKGVFDAIANANGKRIVISGLVIGSTIYNDLPVAVTVSSGDYIFDAYGYSFVITDEDGVTATAIE